MNQSRPPGVGNCLANCSTYCFNLRISAFCRFYWNTFLNSASLWSLHLDFKSLHIATLLSRKLDIVSNYFYLSPLVVIAGDPILIADGVNGLLSPGTVFLLI